MSKTKEEKKEERKERLRQNVSDVADNVKDTVNDTKKSNKVLIAFGILVVLLVAFGMFNNHKDNIKTPEDEVDTVAVDDDYYDEGDLEESSYSLHDEKLVGMWGSGTEDFDDLSDFEGGSWIAYQFTENGFVTRAFASDGETVTDYGKWSTNDKGDLRIDWYKQDDTLLYTEEFIYSTTDGKIILNDEEYTPVTESTIFS